MVSAPTDLSASLAKEYVSIDTSKSTQEAVKFWTREAKFLGLSSISWSLDPAGQCVHVIVRLPATQDSQAPPLLLVHHGDTRSFVNESSQKDEKPEWVQGTEDWYLYGPGALDAKAAGVIFWASIKNSLEKTRIRDLYFIMTCGKNERSPWGVPAFVHFLLKPLPEVQYELSTLEKLELAVLLEKFPSLIKSQFIWNAESFADRSWLEPYVWYPISNVQKGFWSGRVRVSGIRGAMSSTAVRDASKSIQNLLKENEALKTRLPWLHREMEVLVKKLSPAQAWWQRILTWIWPRAFFELHRRQEWVTSWWDAGDLDFDASQGQMVLNLEYRFLGEKQKIEIETDLKEKFRILGAEVNIDTLDFWPFRRNFFEGSEAKIIEDILSQEPMALVSPWISAEPGDSRVFRQTPIRTFDFVPMALTSAEFESLNSPRQQLPYSQLKRGVDIGSRILEKLLQ